MFICSGRIMVLDLLSVKNVEELLSKARLDQENTVRCAPKKQPKKAGERHRKGIEIQRRISRHKNLIAQN